MIVTMPVEMPTQRERSIEQHPSYVNTYRSTRNILSTIVFVP